MLSKVTRNASYNLKYLINKKINIKNYKKIQLLNLCKAHDIDPSSITDYLGKNILMNAIEEDAFDFVVYLCKQLDDKYSQACDDVQGFHPGLFFKAKDFQDNNIFHYIAQYSHLSSKYLAIKLSQNREYIELINSPNKNGDIPVIEALRHSNFETAGILYRTPNFDKENYQDIINSFRQKLSNQDNSKHQIHRF